MSLHVIPTPLAQAALAPPLRAMSAVAAGAAANPRNRSTCGLYDVAGRLGQAHRPAAFLTRYLDALIAGEGFPAPFPIVRAGALVRAAHRDSRWPLVAVEQWFEDRLPPDARGRLDTAERVEIDCRLSARAAALFAGTAA